MASRAPAATRSLLEVLKPSCQCRGAQLSARRKFPRISRDVSTASAQRSEMEVDGETGPRWSQTPTAMQAPFSPRLRPEHPNALKVNSDPRVLDDMYDRFLGPDGHTMLSEETKWLAVTHKSFDHGRRGFNDRLAFMGKRIVELQASLGLLSISESSESMPSNHDPYGRKPNQHPATDAVECLSGFTRQNMTYHRNVAKFSAEFGLPDVVRWVPKNPDSLVASGCDMVYAQAVFAIIGAIALEQGGAVANRIAKERILQPMGMRRRSSPVRPQARIT